MIPQSTSNVQVFAMETLFVTYAYGPEHYDQDANVIRKDFVFKDLNGMETLCAKGVRSKRRPDAEPVSSYTYVLEEPFAGMVPIDLTTFTSEEQLFKTLDKFVIPEAAWTGEARPKGTKVTFGPERGTPKADARAAADARKDAQLAQLPIIKMIYDDVKNDNANQAALIADLSTELATSKACIASKDARIAELSKEHIFKDARIAYQAARIAELEGGARF